MTLQIMEEGAESIVDALRGTLWQRQRKKYSLLKSRIQDAIEQENEGGGGGKE